jgi:hypothetical protein
MGDGAGYGRFEVGDARRRWQRSLVRFTSAHMCFSFSSFHFHFHVSYFKNISGMNSVNSLKKMFDRTSGCIKRAIDWLIGMSMGDV